MSPYDMDKFRTEFEAAAAKFGWTKKEVTIEHERDWDCSWKEIHWYTPSGSLLFSESRLQEGFVKEMIRIAGMIP